MKRVVLALLFLAVVFSCDNPEPYDQELQLIRDTNLIDAFLDENGITAQTDPSGIRYVINENGNGKKAIAPNIVAVNYALYRFTGDIVDTNILDVARTENIYDPMRTYGPFPFQIGSGTVIPGFEIACQILSEGGKGDFYIPSVLGYRNIGSGSIGPNENLYFQIELVEVDVQVD